MKRFVFFSGCRGSLQAAVRELRAARLARVPHVFVRLDAQRSQTGKTRVK